MSPIRPYSPNTSNPAGELKWNGGATPRGGDADDRVCLHPLDGEDALKALLQTPPTKD